MSHVLMSASGWRSNPQPVSPLQCFSDSIGIPLNRKHHSTVQSSLSLSSIFFHPVYSPAAPRTLTTLLSPNPRHCVWWDCQQVHPQCHQPTMLFVSASVIVVLTWIFIPLECVSMKPPRSVYRGFSITRRETGFLRQWEWSVELCRCSLEWISLQRWSERFWKGSE